MFVEFPSERYFEQGRVYDLVLFGVFEAVMNAAILDKAYNSLPCYFNNGVIFRS